MLNKMPDDDPSAGTPAPVSPASTADTRKASPVAWFKELVRGRASNSNQLQEALDDFIEELKEAEPDEVTAESQTTLITNVLRTHDLKVADIMVPRADIIAVEQSADNEALKELFKSNQYSRIPVYRGGLDHVIGLLHIKDLLACLLEGRDCKLEEIVREAMIVGPGMPVMELFVVMRQDKKHMALVVDEHGGIDGLVTLNDVIEAIVGDIEDEFDTEEQPQVIEKADGSIVADARMEIEEFEERYGVFLDAEERDDIETLGGLAFTIAGHVPKRGEVLKHSSGLIMEIVDANASRVKRVRIRNLSPKNAGDEV